MMSVSWSLIVIVAVLALLASKSCGRSLLKLFAVGLVMFFLLLFVWLMLSYDNSGDHHTGHAHSVSTTNPKQASTEQMWQHLNRSRIVLEDETKADETKTDLAKQAATEETEEIDLTEAEEPEQTRPDWVDRPPQRIGNVYRIVVSSGLYKDEPECYRALEPLLSKVVQQRIEQLMPGNSVPELAQLGFGVEYVLRDLCVRDRAWTETSEASFGEMKQVHVQMQFGATQDKQLQTAFRNYQRQARVAKVGGFAGLGLGGLALLYGLLKIAPGRKAPS